MSDNQCHHTLSVSHACLQLYDVSIILCRRATAPLGPRLESIFCVARQFSVTRSTIKKTRRRRRSRRSTGDRRTLIRDPNSGGLSCQTTVETINTLSSLSRVLHGGPQLSELWHDSANNWSYMLTAFCPPDYRIS